MTYVSACDARLRDSTLAEEHVSLGAILGDSRLKRAQVEPHVALEVLKSIPVSLHVREPRSEYNVMQSELNMRPEQRKEIELLSGAFGHAFSSWSKSDDGWSCVGGDCPTLTPPLHLLEAARYAEMQSATMLAADGKQWIAISFPLEGAESEVAVAQIECDAATYAKQLANHVAEVAAQQSMQQVLHDAYAQKLSDSYEEATFLRRLSQQLEYCDASRDLASVAHRVLPELSALTDIECLAVYSAAQKDNEYVLGKLIAHAGKLPDDVSASRAMVTEYTEGNSKTVVRNFDGLHKQGGVDTSKVRSIVTTTLAKDNVIFGWIVGINKNKPHGLGVPANSLGHDEIGSIEASLIETTAGLLSTHAANVQLFHENKSLTIDAIHTLVGVIEARDEYTCGHSDRVALVARHIAEAMGLEEDTCNDIYLTGLLHDIGKVGIPDDVLLKPGQLSDEEFEVIKSHPEVGCQLLQRLSALGDLLPGVLHHHEGYDGKGYPSGLAGEDIPLAARVLAVADAWDAMTSDRPYRSGMPWEKAMSILTEGSGRQWDAKVVEKFREIIDEVRVISETWQDHLQDILQPTTNAPVALPGLQHAAAMPTPTSGGTV